MDELAKFLVKAKISTYASSDEGGETLLQDGCKELAYEENRFLYRDRYFGFDPFIGQEVVWQDKKVIWVMNYCGRILNRTVPAKMIYHFLKEALREVKQDKPFRGPDSFKKEDFEYKNRVEGNIKNFQGTETILYKGKKVYILNYNGGLLNG